MNLLKAQAARHRALTVVEVLMLVFAVFLLIALLLPPLGGSSRSSRVHCVSNLKMVALGYLLWAEEHQKKFPWEVSTKEGGVFEYANSANIVYHVAVVSNQLHSPKLLVCPTDKKRKLAISWTNLTKANVSYFMIPQPAHEGMLLTGDRNVSVNSNIISGELTVTKPDEIHWTKHVHKQGGNVAVTDGTVHQVTTKTLQSFFTNLPTRLVIP